MELRWYQQEAVNAAYSSILKRKSSIIALPTGAGKTPTLTHIVEKYIESHKGQVLVLSHVEEILTQNQRTLKDHLGNIVGLYSAGLGVKNHKRPVVVAGIQSAYRSPELFQNVGLIIIDECHLVNNKNQGMYRTFVDEIQDYAFDDIPIIGLTATPYRLGHGWIHSGSETLFDEICYDGCGMHVYNRLVDEGYLSKIITKGTNYKLDTDGIKTTAGDFNRGELIDRFDQDDVTEEAIKEIIKYGKNYKKWLIFAININHAESIRKSMNDKGIACGIVHSKMDEDRAIEISKFKLGKYRAMVNVDVLTTGFDEPRIDLIAMLRPTKSPIIHVQSVGRGARVHPEKEHCLFLDFAGNTERLGPINNIQPPKKKGSGKGSGDPITKTCPECQVIHHPTVKVCDVCGHEFEFKTKLSTTASTAQAVVTGSDLIKEFRVTKISYSIYKKPGKTDTLRVQYHCGLRTFSEWIAYGRDGFGGVIAKNWVAFRLDKVFDMPKDVNELFEKSYLLEEPTRIVVDLSGKYPSIKKHIFPS
jgi:DNA repair protein RadD